MGDPRLRGDDNMGGGDDTAGCWNGVCVEIPGGGPGFLHGQCLKVNAVMGSRFRAAALYVVLADVIHLKRNRGIFSRNAYFTAISAVPHRINPELLIVHFVFIIVARNVQVLYFGEPAFVF